MCTINSNLHIDLNKCYSENLDSNISENVTTTKTTNVLTVPKSGTSMVRKIIRLLGFIPVPRAGEEGIHFLGYKGGILKDKSKLDSFFLSEEKFILGYRDPRDALVSMINYIKLNPDVFLKPTDPFREMTNEEILDQFFNLKPKNCLIPSHVCGVIPNSYIAADIISKKYKQHLYVKFEDLMPTEAGGDDSTCYETIKSIQKFLCSKNNDALSKHAYDNFFGNSGTYNKNTTKKIGQWKENFKKRHIKAFHEKYNDLLLKLGYETDPNWHLKYLANKKN